MQPRNNVLGVWVDNVSAPQLNSMIEAGVRDGAHALVLYVNAHGLNLAAQDAWMRRFLNSASVVFADGVGVSLAGRILGYRSSGRIPVTEWIWQLAEFAEARKLSLYLLGSMPSVADDAARRLRDRHPELSIVGTHHGYFDKRPGSIENRAVVEGINRAKPDILIVGFGMPIQERWLHDNWDDVDARVAVTGGAVLDYTSGRVRRGPSILTNHGLEWLARLIIEPRRLWKRYVVGNPTFVARVLRQRFRRRDMRA